MNTENRQRITKGVALLCILFHIKKIHFKDLIQKVEIFLRSSKVSKWDFGTWIWYFRSIWLRIFYFQSAKFALWDTFLALWNHSLINQITDNLRLQWSSFWPVRTVLFSSPTPKICINRGFDYPKICIIWDFDYPKICITVERDGKINRLIRFDERGFDCSSHVIFDYTGANFEP